MAHGAARGPPNLTSFLIKNYKKNPPSYLKVIGTNSLRNINDNDFLKAMENTLGSSIEVISPDQEGKLIYDGVVNTTNISPKNYYILDIFVKQNGNGNKTLNMTVRTDGGEQSIIQKDSGAHTATIDLTGSYHTDLDLKQQGSTNQSYSLTQNCQTSGGCGISLTQGN